MLKIQMRILYKYLKLNDFDLYLYLNRKITLSFLRTFENFFFVFLLLASYNFLERDSLIRK